MSIEYRQKYPLDIIINRNSSDFPMHGFTVKKGQKNPRLGNLFRGQVDLIKIITGELDFLRRLPNDHLEQTQIGKVRRQG